MIERSGYLPAISFSADADWETLFSVVSEWTCEVVLDDDTYYQGVVRWDFGRRCYLVWDEDTETELILLDDDTLNTVREVVVF